MTLYLGSDHAGFAAKEALKRYLQESHSTVTVSDLGTHDVTSVHYPDYAEKVAREVVKGKNFGILLCGSGLGVAIAANKVHGVRAVTAWDATSARLAREHNDANILCLGARLLGEEVMRDAVAAFLSAKFQGGRHGERVALITALENK